MFEFEDTVEQPSSLRCPVESSSLGDVVGEQRVQPLSTRGYSCGNVYSMSQKVRELCGFSLIDVADNRALGTPAVARAYRTSTATAHCHDDALASMPAAAPEPAGYGHVEAARRAHLLRNGLSISQ